MSILKSLHEVGPAAERQRAELRPEAVKKAIREAYLRQPDSPDDADDWSNAEEWKA